MKVAKSTFEYELGASVIVANKFGALEGRPSAAGSPAVASLRMSSTRMLGHRLKGTDADAPSPGLRLPSSAPQLLVRYRIQGVLWARHSYARACALFVALLSKRRKANALSTSA